MTTASKVKRLDSIEVNLSPKEWAIRTADEMRAAGADQAAFIKKMEEVDPFDALDRQAEQRHPGGKPEDISARNRLRRELATEFHALKKLIGVINEKIQNRIERAGLEAALKISTLQTVILQDAFGRTAKRAAEWIDSIRINYKDEEQERLVMLEELKAYMDVDFGEKMTDSIRIGDMKLRFPTVIEDWLKEAIGLIGDIYAHEAAVAIVQDQQFDSHPILIPVIEAGLKRTIQAVEDAAASFNDYLDVRMKLFKAVWEYEEKHEGGLVSAIPGEMEGALKVDLKKIKTNSIRFAKVLAKEWMTSARDEAIFDIRQMYGERDAAFREYIIKRGWIKP